ncbi:2-dehydropantoate 2-reductase [Roseicella sp. DB1501]|uniref:2-dehydropantoate 2-reductase n=1 Tax=Roseicella sp. DB1501 TaxID=2730925 RepID=UPI0014912459|nr:2-dehydropantoate 2-reductase [Roseicella sp. DB1501]NOG73473.1 2-dehydropantoate 2-reductase [Roseicella sp. DB1501]
MRILVIGAGALGGYFGGRLLEAGRDVTFLVRPRRAEQLARHGLVLDSLHGNASLRPRTVQASGLEGPYDLVLLAVKAPALEAAMADMAPAVGPGTTILPVLNGMRHLDLLGARFGAARVLGGVAQIPATLGPEGQVIHRMSPDHQLIFGEVAGGLSDRVRAIEAAFAGANFRPRASEAILQEMWEKWAGLASLAGATCLMRGTVGDILAAPGGEAFLRGIFAECSAVAAAAGHALRPPMVEAATSFLGKPGSLLTASMLRDVERGSPAEGEHVLGDMIARAGQLGVPVPLLALARLHLGTYEARRRREAAAG